MGRKLAGRKLIGKGLKGALQAHNLQEQYKQHTQKTSQSLKEQAAGKQKLIKAGGQQKKSAKAPAKAKAFLPFKSDETLLLVGEGDFSYAVSLVQNGYMSPENLVATGYDTEAQVQEKYPHAGENVAFLKDMGVRVLHSIDATDLVGSLKVAKKKVFLLLQHVMFNFPHTGRGMTDENRNIRDHQHLVLGYLQSAKKLLQVANRTADTASGYFQNGTRSIIMTVFEGEPYVSWGIKALARSVDYKVERSGAFDWGAFPGYCHRRTDGMGNTTKKAAERSARTYVFTRFVKKEAKKAEVSDSD